MIAIGSKVRKIHAFDGTKRAGSPVGPTLTVKEIKDHVPVDGPRETKCFVVLSDGSWEFIWNLVEIP